MREADERARDGPREVVDELQLRKRQVIEKGGRVYERCDQREGNE